MDKTRVCYHTPEIKKRSNRFPDRSPRVAIIRQKIIPRNTKQDRTDRSSIGIPPVSRKRKTLEFRSEPFFGREKPLEFRSKPFSNDKTLEFLSNHFQKRKFWNSVLNHFRKKKNSEFHSEPFSEEKTLENLFQTIFEQKTLEKRQLLLAVS